MDLKRLKELHDKAYTANEVTRERAADDLVFYWVTQWDDNTLDSSQLAYRGEFNILRKAGRQILADLASNPVQVDFEPIDDTSAESSDLLDGLYRNDDSKNTTQDAYQVATQDSVVAGFGAWVLYTDYVTNRAGNNNQIIKRRPIHEANNVCYFDPNSKLLDKSDSMYCSLLVSYTEEGYKELYEDLTGEELENVSMSTFKDPEQSYTFPWLGGESKKVYVTEFYHREKVKSKALTLTDPFGMTMDLMEDKLSEVMDEMLDSGFEIVGEKKIEHWQVTKYIASGAEILNGEMGPDDERLGEVVAGEHIPVVPVYGERTYVEGEEHYEGITRLAKDPQRLRNFQLSYLADIVSQSPRPKPIYYQEQIAGFEDMYTESGADDNYPYRVMNRVGVDGSPLPLGPIGVTPEQSIPSALIASVELSRQAVEDVANPGMPQDIADPDLSGKAVIALQNRVDMQSMIYQENLKHAKRRDAEIYASMAIEIYDAPRKTTVTKADGSRETIEVMSSVIDEETGDIVTLNDISNAQFEVYSKIGPSYNSRKDQTIEMISQMVSQLEPGNKMREALMLKQLGLMDGVDFDEIREYANKELVKAGIKKPETPEEQQMMEAIQNQEPQPDPNMVLAQAEMVKGQASVKKAETDQAKLQLTAYNDKVSAEIDTFKAQTDRMKVMVDAQVAKVNIDNKEIEAVGKKIDNAAKLVDVMNPLPQVPTEANRPNANLPMGA